MSDRKPSDTLFRFQNFVAKSNWIRGTAVSAGGILLFCCMTILTVSSCTLGNN
jgi:hypothetical protein